MPAQLSPPAENTRFQRNPAVLTPTARVPLEHTPSVHQWSARAIIGEVEDEKGAESLEEEDSGETEVANALENAPEVPQSSNLDLSSKPNVSQTEPSLLKMMQKMTQFMGNPTLSVAPRANSKAPAFKTPSIKAPDYFDGTQAHELGGFIQSFQLIFHNDPADFFSDRKKILYSTFLSLVELGNGLKPTF
ncbi:hypothetical protein O181_034806 [Austropuccinia psidii MF-1]|uniref:Uncharacterized protein n=1 Tax=Austropuccinia psidii MF-1 TaxID=1389203 RepID=A0A9Q3D1H6_9BASI|nr:hypothetical protein [Austropuccinia psidii MF-1]